MQLRSAEEVKKIDASLEIVSEDSWDFFGVTEDDENYEYYNDFRDDQFRDTLSNRISVSTVIIAMLSTMFLTVVIVISVMGIISSKNDSELISLRNLDNALTSKTDETLVGSSVSSRDLVNITLTIQDYFSSCSDLVNNGDELDSLCGGSSVVKENTYGYLNQSEVLYDEYDCRYRILGYQLQNIDSASVSQAVYNEDGSISCSIKVSWVDTSAIRDWVLRNQTNLCKYAISSTSETLVLHYLVTNFDNDNTQVSHNTDYIHVTLKPSESGEWVLDDTGIYDKLLEVQSVYITQSEALLSK